MAECPISKIEHAAIKALARQIARDILLDGRGMVGHRVQIMHGSYPDKETSGGGRNENSLATLIEKHLTGEKP